MATSEHLRALRAQTVINATSKDQEKEVVQALRIVEKAIKKKYNVALDFTGQWFIREIVEKLRASFPTVDFHYHFETRCLVPESRDATVTREGEEALWQAVFMAAPERRREFEPSSKRRKRRAAPWPGDTA